jgi:hypothetical protein
MKPIANGCRLVLFGLLLTACDKATGLDYDALPESICTIAQLKLLCDGQSRTIADQTSVRGIVTANNRYGEFPGQLVIEDATGGIAIAADYPAADNAYPLGEEAVVYCNGLTLYDYGGKIELGKIGDGTTRIPREELGKHLRKSGKTPVRKPARAVRIDELTAAHVDTYVRIDGVHFVETGTWCDRDPETGRPRTSERTVADARGNRLTVRTAGSATYANDPLPSGSGSLCGIVDYFNGVYSLRVTGFEAYFAATPATPPTAYP